MPTTLSEVANPPDLFRYLHFEEKQKPVRHLVWEELLLHGRMQLSNPNWFNDPFDPIPSFSEMAKVSSEITAKEKAVLAAQQRRISDANWIKNEESRLRGLYQGHWEATQHELLDRYRRELGDIAGIMCISETHHCNLMWSHYANNHRGFVVKLNFAKEPLLRMKALTHKIEYPKSRERPKAQASGVARWPDLITKSYEWRYEKEWRSILDLQKLASSNDKGHFIELDPSSISEIYLGWRFDPKARPREFANLTAFFRGAKVFKMFPTENTFDLIAKAFSATG